MSTTGPRGEEAEHHYRKRLRELRIELVKFQRRLIERGERVLVLIEGPDAAGKDGVIKHIVKHLSPRDTRVVALAAPPIPNARRGISSATSSICRRRRSSSCRPGNRLPVRCCPAG